jgi:isocitrate dehydrogenase kinase/phosphatase
MVSDFGLCVPFEDFERDTQWVYQALLPLFDHQRLRANFQIQVLFSLSHQKDTTRERIRDKYLLVKQHDRVGRMADTLEFTMVRKVFMQHHADLLEAQFWQSHKERILAGHVHDVYPYDQDKRFIHQCAQT